MKEIPLTNSPLKAIVDSRDYSRVSKYSWHIGAYGYVVHSFFRKKHLILSRLIMRARPGQLVDHKYHNLLDNRRFRLRIATRMENSQNKTVGSRKKSGASSQYKGVCWNKRRKKWRTQIGVNNKRLTVGHFVNELDAAIAYNRAARRNHGRFACLNPV